MNLKLKEKIKESLSAVLPITGIVLMLSIFLVPMELGSIVMFPYRSGHADRRNGIFPARRRDGDDADRRRRRRADLENEKSL